MRVEAARRSGRSHRRNGVPCQDAYASWTGPSNHAFPADEPASPDGSGSLGGDEGVQAPDSQSLGLLVGRRACVAVADGLGSKPLSQHGSQAACDAAVAFLASQVDWTEQTLLDALHAASSAVAQVARELGVPSEALATTLQLACRDGGQVLAAMVGDGAIVAIREGQATVVLGPPPGQYANEVMPITHEGWQGHVQLASAQADGPVLVFSDGLVRLLLKKEKDGWRPFDPFFAAFLPHVGRPGLVQRFLDGDDVDSSWDDDKCLAVIHADAT